MKTLSNSTTTAIVGRKLQSLDGLRAIAIILVLCRHVQNHIPVVNRPTSAFKLYLSQGWVGVDLFFVLSGFLITGLLLDSRDAQNYFSGFYVRRVLRIFPLYYVVLTAILVLSYTLTRVHATNAPAIASLVPLPEDRWVYFCYLTNWIRLWKAQWIDGFSSILAHFWSLAIEEQFYFVWPFIVWVVRPRAIPWIAGIVAGLSAIIRLAWVAHTGVQIVPPQSIEIQLATICRLDSLFAGVLCACFFRNESLMPRIRPWLKWIAALTLGSFSLAFSALIFFPMRAWRLLYGSNPTVYHSLEDAVRLLLLCGGYAVLAIGFGALVLLAAYTETKNTFMQKFLKSRLLAPIGLYSYGIYVFHVPIIGAAQIYLFPRVASIVNNHGHRIFMEYAYIVALASIIFGASALSYELFEKKILRFKRYFEPKYALTLCEAGTAEPAVAQEAAGD